ncbi:AAA family ATPase [Amorphus sp. 3PC139-8]|uniref:AAA family ATPase n=1 Tax=Amorphus sp. 3PC139-8 TaxID=2735676 RepID=UPI00345DA445
MSGDNTADLFSKYAGAVAKELYGQPNDALSSEKELRFRGKGSLSVDLTKGTFFDYEDQVGGGVLALIERATGRKGRERFDWLRENGFDIDDRRPAGPAQASHGKANSPPWKIVKTWDYHSASGELVFQVVRMENGETGKDGKPVKTYRQRRPDTSKASGWDWSVKGLSPVPYNLPDVTEAIAHDRVVFIVEGEKCADRLIDLGVPATTNPGGAGKWRPDLDEVFRGARIVILPDNDAQATTPDGIPRFHEDGRPVFVGPDHARAVAKRLYGIAKDVRILELPGLPIKGDVDDWLDAGGTVETLFDLARSAPVYEPEPFRSRFNAIPWAALDAPGPEHEWLIKGVLTRGEISMTAGPSQSGKSFLAVDIAMAVLRGCDWMRCRTRRGGVIYQAGEGQKGLKKRLRAYRQANGLTGNEPMPFVLLPKRLDLYGSDDPTEAFIEEARHWSSTFDVPLELIVIDTWATATPGANENDGKDVSAALQRCARISEACRATVLLVHHMNADGAKVRGHTSILANLENVLLVRPCDGRHDTDGRQVREAVVEKNKDGEGGRRFDFVLPAFEIGRDEDDEPVTSCVVTHPNGEGSADARPRNQGVSISSGQGVLVRAMERAIDESGGPAPAECALPRSLTVVEWRNVVAAYDRIAFDEADTANESDDDRQKRIDRRRQAMHRAGEGLLKLGVIGREKPWVWFTGKPIKGMRRGSPPPRDPDPAPRDAMPPAPAPAPPPAPIADDDMIPWGDD